MELKQYWSAREYNTVVIKLRYQASGHPWFACCCLFLLSRL